MQNKKTKIIATVWPSTSTKTNLIKLYKKWVNVIRFNFSHANYENISKIINLIKKLNSEWKTNLSILMDTKWPELRTWNLTEKIKYRKSETFRIYFNSDNIQWSNSLYCDYPYLNDLAEDDIIRIDSGLFDVQVKQIHKDYVVVKALNDATIWSHRHINLPWKKIKLPGLTSKDIEDIKFWIDHGVDFIAMSFVRNKENILELKKLLKQYNQENISIVSKIENKEWINNLESIIDESHWVMIARWDLGIELPIEKLPMYQKKIINQTRKKWKFVILATHLLETMTKSPFPTRAEIDDIDNAINQQVDSVMLSAETAVGKYPISCVWLLSKTIKNTEKSIHNEHTQFEESDITPKESDKKEMIRYSYYLWEQIWVNSLVILTETWLLAKFAALYRPNIKVFAFTNKESTFRYMNILYGITPVFMDFDQIKPEIMQDAVNYLINSKKIKQGDKVIWVTDLLTSRKDIPIMEVINTKKY